jgi:hypothetical protein
MAESDTVNWKFPETWLTLTKTDLSLAVQAGAQYIQSCFDWELNITEQIDLAETKEQLLAIVIIEQNNSLLEG